VSESQPDPSGTYRAVLLVDHGSRVAEANAVLDQLAVLVRRQLPERLVGVAHMELASPSIAQAVDALVAAGATEVVVHPYFLGPGSHSTRDIPEQVRRAAQRYPELAVQVTQPLGVHAGLVEAVVARIREVDREPTRGVRVEG
jgi:sirohydrochlorin ferrochelatase